MARTSSPGTYSRTSANSMPRPRNEDEYAPESTESTVPRARISICRTLRRISEGIMGNAKCGMRKAKTERCDESRRPGRFFAFRFSFFAFVSGNFHLVEHALHDVLGADVLGLGLVGEQHAV